MYQLTFVATRAGGLVLPLLLALSSVLLPPPAVGELLRPPPSEIEASNLPVSWAKQPLVRAGAVADAPAPSLPLIPLV
jgi:hypothetical protein